MSSCGDSDKTRVSSGFWFWSQVSDCLPLLCDFLFDVVCSQTLMWCGVEEQSGRWFSSHGWHPCVVEAVSSCLGKESLTLFWMKQQGLWLVSVVERKSFKQMLWCSQWVSLQCSALLPIGGSSSLIDYASYWWVVWMGWPLFYRMLT